MTRLRVLVVQAFGENGGSESWLLRLLDATDALDVSVLLLKDGPLRAQLEARGIPVEVQPVGRQPWHVLWPAVRLARRLRRERPDVVLGNVLKAQLVAAPAGLLAGVPTVWAKHDHGYDSSLARPLAMLSTAVVAAVEELAEATGRDDAVIIPPPRPAAPPATREQARAHLAELGLSLRGDDPILVMAGRLVPFKGVDDALHALALPEAASWRLVVIGTDDHSSPGETRRLSVLAEQFGLGDRVLFAGWVADISHWLAAFDALAVLTRPGGRRAPKREGFGTSAFEAMVAGLPVVAVTGGAVVRRLAGVAGIGVPAADPGAVAAALAALSDPERRRVTGAAGQAITRDHPDAQTCASALVDVLQWTARNHSHARRRGDSPRARAGRIRGRGGAVGAKRGSTDQDRRKGLE